MFLTNAIGPLQLDPQAAKFNSGAKHLARKPGGFGMIENRMATVFSAVHVLFALVLGDKSFDLLRDDLVPLYLWVPPETKRRFLEMCHFVALRHGQFTRCVSTVQTCSNHSEFRATLELLL